MEKIFLKKVKDTNFAVCKKCYYYDSPKCGKVSCWGIYFKQIHLTQIAPAHRCNSTCFFWDYPKICLELSCGGKPYVKCEAMKTRQELLGD